MRTKAVNETLREEGEKTKQRDSVLPHVRPARDEEVVRGERWKTTVYATTKSKAQHRYLERDENSRERSRKCRLAEPCPETGTRTAKSESLGHFCHVRIYVGNRRGRPGAAPTSGIKVRKSCEKRRREVGKRRTPRKGGGREKNFFNEEKFS